MVAVVCWMIGSMMFELMNSSESPENGEEGSDSEDEGSQRGIVIPSSDEKRNQ